MYERQNDEKKIFTTFKWLQFQHNIFNLEIIIKEIDTMTTISNFLNGKFIDQQSQLQKQVPIWVVTAEKTHNPTIFPEYLIEQSIKKNRPLIHLDLGLKSLKKHQEKNCTSVSILNGFKFLIPHQGSPYYLLRWTTQERKDPKCLKLLIEAINNLEKSQAWKNQVAGKNKTHIGLIVEGLQLLTSLPNFSQEIQSFISCLSNLNRNFKQIAIFTLFETLSKEHRFALERISTCLTNFEQYEASIQKWTCISTVRRYTGFSNEEKYVITSNNGVLKVEKWMPPKAEGQTEAQKQMVNSLGFVVKKDQETKKQQEELKKMIYPHLRVQDNCACGKASCKCMKKEDDTEGLIILDDQQEDQDDIDV